MEEAADRRAAMTERLRWASLVVLSTVCVVAAWTAVTGLLDARDLDRREDARAAAVEAAEKKVVDLTTLRAESGEQDLARLLEGTTPTFREEFEAQADSFVAALRQGKVDAEGKVTEAAVKQLGDDTASVLVAASGSVSNSEVQDAQPRYYRLLVNLVRDDDDWLVDRMEFVS